MNQMGRSKINYRNDEVPAYYAWNPGGCGCSGGGGWCLGPGGAGPPGDPRVKRKGLRGYMPEKKDGRPGPPNPSGRGGG